MLETGTWSTGNVKGSVEVEESSALHSSHRGRLVSVRKYKKETGLTPAPGNVVTNRSRNGKTKEMVKMYAHCDSSSWSFTDEDAEVVKKTRVVDDGSIVVDEGQMQAQYNSARKMLTGYGGAGKLDQCSPKKTEASQSRENTEHNEKANNKPNHRRASKTRRMNRNVFHPWQPGWGTLVLVAARLAQRRQKVGPLVQVKRRKL